ncbi:FAD-binding oxidoreductase [Puniceibacterium sp. HSS470]|jgi:glycine/D-amino acid oxidase-like deaminating enzyme|nr:FAD-binding oxidoreductase [Puniceibacterium sp. HSS470]|tara:strand:- start:15980 stop:17242 length:1263 start_codon:yes stop_codon:yes gene_type:complete
MKTDSAISLWDASAAEPRLDHGFDGDQITDLAIVGGGFTGLSTALHAGSAGHDCMVLEANSLGHGGSGRNVGLVNAGVWLPPRRVQHLMGDDMGRRFVTYFGAAPDYVFDLIEKHQIRCEARRNGTIHAAHAPSGMADLTARAQDWRALGAPVDLLNRDQIAEMIGSRAFHGGLVDRRAGTINPMGYVRGLARAASAAGARIATHTRVTKLSRENDHWHLATPRGTVRARHVVLGTNAYSDDLWPGLRRSLTLIPFFQLASDPLGQAGAHILPGGQGLWDTAPIMFSLRRDAAGRLIVGSMGRVHPRLSHRWATRQIRRIFPELGDIAFPTAWHGQIAMTPDHLPRIHRLADGLYTPIGYNGRGITTGTMFGRAMADLLSGTPEADLPMPLSGVVPDRAGALKSRVYRLGFTLNQVFKSI